MKRTFLFLFGIFLLMQGVSAQQRFFEFKDETPENGVFSGLDDEAGVIIVCDQKKELSFESSMDKKVYMFKKATEGSNTLYYLIFKVGRKYEGRVLSIICSGYATFTVQLDLQPKQLKRYLIYDPNDAVDAGCYQQHRAKAMKYFDKCNYREAKTEFELALSCTDANKDEALQRISLCDTILVLKDRADVNFSLLKYAQAATDYRKIESMNPMDTYVIDRLYQCNQTQDTQCSSYYIAAEGYYKEKEYDKARTLYQRIVDQGCSQSADAMLKITEIDRLMKKTKNRERVLSWEYDAKAPIGFSYGTYGQHSHGYFSLRMNNQVFDLARSNYSLDHKPELNISFGWTVNVVKKYGWIFFGPGLTTMVKYTVDPEMYLDRKGAKDKDVENVTQEDVEAKAKATGKEVKDYEKPNFKFAVSPEVGFVVKYGPAALRYTFQYRFAISKNDEDFIGKVRNVIGIGFAF